MLGRTQAGSLFGKRADAPGKRNAHAGKPHAQCSALRRGAPFQLQDAFFQLQDGDGAQVERAGAVLGSPMAHFGGLIGFALAQL